MGVVTFFFAGTGHGIDRDFDDDSLVETYNKCTGKKAFFPGPGATPGIYASGFDLGTLRPLFGRDVEGPESTERGSLIGYNTKIKESGSKAKRSLGGKGWDRNVWYALNLIAAELASTNDQITLNLVGHSRGSITVIMLLNDMFYEHTGMHLKLKGNRGAFKLNEAGVKDTWSPKKGDFGNWYLKQIEAVWKRRLGRTDVIGEKLAKRGVEALQTIKENQGKFACINAWLYDPVAGKSSALTSRKQEFPPHPLIKRVRVLRMEQGGMGGALSSGMPTFGGWAFLDGTQTKNLRIFSDNERLVIPLPGTHGAGLSLNIKHGKATTRPQWYIGTSYMVGLLQACGTKFEEGFPEFWTNTLLLLTAYDLLLEAYRNVLPGKGDVGKDRAKIHTHHTAAGYAGGVVNADHRYLKEHRKAVPLP